MGPMLSNPTMRIRHQKRARPGRPRLLWDRIRFAGVLKWAQKSIPGRRLRGTQGMLGVRDALDRFWLSFGPFGVAPSLLHYQRGCRPPHTRNIPGVLPPHNPPGWGAAALQTPRGGFGGGGSIPTGGSGGREPPKNKAGVWGAAALHGAKERRNEPPQVAQATARSDPPSRGPRMYLDFPGASVTMGRAAGAMDATKPYKIHRVWGHGCHQTL